MKKNLLLSLGLIVFCTLSLHAQVTQINANKSLQVVVPLSSAKTFLTSELDSSIWVTDATLAGTVQISPNIKFDDDWGLLNGKIIFRGSTLATGSEVYISDGTPAGTVLVSDINAGAAGSDPGDFVLLNGFLYFTAETPAAGRELWRTNGTAAGTTLVKDILAGAAGSFNENNEVISSNGTFLLFAANTASGNELWKSDGTNAGTVLLKDIYAGADSSNPDNFTMLNNLVLFTARDATHGDEIWKTDGTAAGTVLLKDINAGAGNSTTVDLFPGFSSQVFIGFHIFNNHAYFNANNGTSAGGIWGTDGTTGNTILIKDFPYTLPNYSRPLLIDALNLSNKFIFPYGDGSGRSELWQCDGTAAGTVLFKSFSPTTPGETPFIALPYSVDFINQTLTYPLFQGNKFFFFAGAATQGTELWVSDGTLAGTNVVKDINPGTGDGIDFSKGDGSYLYTSTTFFFGASDATHGSELWQTAGTAANTMLVQDINPNAGNANPELSIFVANGKVIFGATDGNPSDQSITDLFVLGGTFVPLPVRLLDFTVAPKNSDALLAWSTSQELNTKNFTVQRSYDAQHFEDIGIVQAMGTSYNRHGYTFTDAGIANSGKNIIYYRLLATDINGKSVNTNVISLKLKGNSSWNVRLLSNPVQDNLNVILSGITGNVQLSVRDISGKTIYTKSLENINGQINLPAVLQRGVYILEAKNNNERKAIKFVK